MTIIELTIFDNAEQWLRDNLPNMQTDHLSPVYRIGRFLPDGFTTYQDEEDDKEYIADMGDHVRALEMLCEQVCRTLWVGGIKSPFDLLDAGNWDVEVVDAYFQLVTIGEVVYG